MRTLALCLMMTLVAVIPAAADLTVANGHSTLTDARRAGIEAARATKDALGDAEPTVVLLFDSLADDQAAKEQLLEGVTSVFDGSLVHGCSSYNPLTQVTNTGTVGVLALSGDIAATTALAEVGEGHESCGKALGESLKAAADAAGDQGKLLVLFGSCHVPADDDLVRGACGVLGEQFPAAGAAASGGEWIYHEGKIVRTSNVGVLLTGDFRVSMSTKTAGQDSPPAEDVVRTAREAAVQAMGDNQDRAKLALVFDCGGRRAHLGDRLPDELAAMKEVLGDIPLFGFYGSGEIGPVDNSSPSRGVGFHVSICIILEGLDPPRQAEAPEGARPLTGDFAEWTTGIGTWSSKGGSCKQTSIDAGCLAFAPSAKWRDYTYEVKARKTAGHEGFLILFRVQDAEHFYWWNIGGWANGMHAVETRPRTRNYDEKRPASVETGRWYDVKIVLEGASIKCYLDGELTHEVTDDTYAWGGIGLGSWRTAVEYKDVKVTSASGEALAAAGPVGKTYMAADLYRKLGTWPETMLALRAAVSTDRSARPGERPYDLWTGVGRDFPALVEQMRLYLTPREMNSWFDRADSVALERELLARAIDDLADGHGARESLETLVAAREPPSSTAWLDLFARISRQLRDDKVARCPPIAFIKRTAHARKGTNGTMLGQLNLGARMGSSICVYDPAHAEDGAKVAFHSDTGFIFDMSPSYDGKKLLFSFMDNVHDRSDSFHIWEVNVDGTGLRQITGGPYHDASPAYLPDGRIVFCSTRVESFSLCQDFLAAALFVVNPDGGDLHRIEYTTLCDTTPFVMDDGSLLFTRWEYQDKNIFCTQGLWTLRPDGTHLQLYYGNTLTIPNSICGARQIPGSTKVVCTMAAHHGRPLGAIGLIDRAIGLENPRAMVNLTPEIPYQPTVADVWNPVAPNNFWAAGDVQYAWAYGDPWPLAEDLFLVAYGGPLEGGPQRYRLLLLDDRGQKVPLYEDPDTSCFNPVPLAPRPLPHPMPRSNETPVSLETGTLYVTDIYRDLVDKGVQRGQVKALRVMSQPPKRWNTEGPRYHDHYPVIGQGSYYPKIDYGTVPVDEDGSAYFEAPAGVELYFIALDEHGKEIRRMGSTTQLTPGESQGCVGCHATLAEAPPPAATLAARLGREPDAITPPPWGAGPVDYVKQVQPVLDRYCVSCHSGRAPDARIDLTGDRSRLYNMSYRALLDGGYVTHYYINQGPTGNFQPLQSGSWVSPLTELIESEHQNVKMGDESRRRVYAWIDANAPYYSTWDMSRPYTMGGRDTWSRLQVTGQRGPLEPEPWYADFRRTFDQRCLSCHADENPNQAHGTRSYAWLNLTTPEHSRALNAHLSSTAGGLGLTTPKDGKEPPLFESTDDPRYQAMLAALRAGKVALEQKPRMDMAGGIAVPQERNFGRLY